MKTKVLDINGQTKKTIELPKFFENKIREDIVAKILELKKRQQPYSPSSVAGKQHAAKGKIVHRRHVWRSGYGRGQSRVPRKMLSQKGTRFNWVAAEVPNARGGMRAHPPKILHFLKELKINKKENKIAFESALSATGNKKFVEKKYVVGIQNPEDARETASVILKVLENPGKFAAKKPETLSWKESAKRHLEIYRKILPEELGGRRPH